jgi:hypothetical protein
MARLVLGVDCLRGGDYAAGGVVISYRRRRCGWLPAGRGSNARGELRAAVPTR